MLTRVLQTNICTPVSIVKDLNDWHTRINQPSLPSFRTVKLPTNAPDAQKIRPTKSQGDENFAADKRSPPKKLEFNEML